MRLRPAQSTARQGQGSQPLVLRDIPSVELDRRIRAGSTEWVELQDALLSTGGLLPPPMLVARLARFIEDLYWEAEEARIEAFRRQRAFDGLGRREPTDAGWELV